MKTIIAGGRTFADYELLCAVMDQRGEPVTEVVSGAATGADALGERWAKERGIPVKRFPANWEAQGRAAGPLRNGRMAAYGEALVAFWDGQSRGTKNMIEQAKRAGLRVTVRRTDA